MDSRKQKRLILLVEDDPADQAIVRRALQGCAGSVELHIASDGQEALDYLYGRGGPSDPEDAVLPDLLLLDLNMPRVDGKEVISALRSDERFRTVPIVALTTSSSEQDVHEVYALGANSYVVKPAGIDDLRQLLDLIQAYWFGAVELPAVF